MALLDWLFNPGSGDVISNWLKQFGNDGSTTVPIPPSAIAPRTFQPGTLAPFNNDATRIRNLITGRPTIPLAVDGPVNEPRPSVGETGQLDMTGRTVPARDPMPAVSSSPVSPGAQPSAPETPTAPGMLATPPGAPSPADAAPQQPSIWERIFGKSEEDPMNLDINRRINFSRNALPWQVLANIGAGMINRPAYQGFMGALGEGAKQGLKTAQDFPMNQLRQALGETQLGTLQFQMASRQALLRSIPNIKDPTAKMAMIAALNDNSGRTMAALFAPNSPVRLNPAKGTWEINKDLVAADEMKRSTEEDVKNSATRLTEAAGMNKGAGDTLDLISKIREVVPFVKTGVHQENITYWGGVLSRLGLGDDTKQVPAEVLRKLLTQLQVSYTKQNFPQRITNNDLVISALANANENMLPASIEKALGVTERESRKIIDYYNQMSKFSSDNRGRLNPGEGRPSFDEIWNKNRGYNTSSPEAPKASPAPPPGWKDTGKRTPDGRPIYTDGMRTIAPKANY